MDIFLIVSGVGLALSQRELPLLGFLRRRALRIFPMYWIALAAFLWGNTHFLQRHYTPLDIGSHILGLHDLFGTAIGFSINDSFWFVTLILFLYPCFYYIKPLLREPDRYILITGAISAFVALLLFELNEPGLMGHIGFRLPSFFFGALLGRALRDGRLTLPLNARLALGIFFFVFVPYTQGITMFTGVAGVSLVAAYTFFLRHAVVRSRGAQNTLTWLGRHSLEIFLFHQPLMREYNVYLQGRWFNINQPSEFSLIVGMTIAVMVTLVLAAELRKLEEKFLPA